MLLSRGPDFLFFFLTYFFFPAFRPMCHPDFFLWNSIVIGRSAFLPLTRNLATVRKVWRSLLRRTVLSLQWIVRPDPEFKTQTELSKNKHYTCFCFICWDRSEASGCFINSITTLLYFYFFDLFFCFILLPDKLLQ